MAVGKEEIVKELLTLKGWEKLNVTEQKAFNEGLLDSNRNFVVVAPTASGKTCVAELVMLQTLKAGGRIAYLVPMKPLISDKEREFLYLKQNYKIVGMDAMPRDWDAANIVITTFELFYRTALTARHHVEGFKLVVIDEFHVLYDPLRGFNLEKVITILKELNVRIICLSATFEDKNEIGEWLDAKVIEVPEELRVVPLKYGVIDLSEVNATQQNRALCESLLEKGQHPYIIFCTTRESTKSRALEMCQLIQKLSANKKDIAKAFERELERQQFTDLEENLCNCLCKKVAFHHSGLDPRLRTLVENLFLNGEIDYLFATTGLAYGINFPARTVVLSDVTFYDPNTRSRVSVPVYMYIQMAGRAGRPQFGTEGYAYVVAKRIEELTSKIPQYLNGKIEKAHSHIARDEYFRKAILELIYSGRCTDAQILGFFEKTFYNFQSRKVTRAFMPFDLFGILGRHVKYLCDAGFMSYLGAPGYKLTDLGQVTLRFLFSTFAPYELTPFLELNKYLDDEGGVTFDFDLIYTLSRLFEGAILTKIPRETSQQIEEFYETQGVTDCGHAEYSAYAVFFGWIENMEEYQIERDFKVYASQLPQVAGELDKLLLTCKLLARAKNFIIPPQFKILRDRIRKGVRSEEVPFVKLKGIGRTTARNLYEYCKNVLAKPPLRYSGTVLDMLKTLYKDRGETNFIKIHVRYIQGIGEEKAKRILELVKRSLGIAP
ncbi:MAG: putative ski2-type helicase [Candidatus Bathyarchaeota archaeon BA2]|nr:MAG: putative ski2-type helicase [Candidatus Bathyarchaeota archaeon BA2]